MDSYSPRSCQMNTHHHHFPPPSGSGVLCLPSWDSLLLPQAVPRSHNHTQTHGMDMYTQRHTPVHMDTGTTCLPTHAFPEKNPPHAHTCTRPHRHTHMHIHAHTRRHMHTHTRTHLASHNRQLSRFAICSPRPSHSPSWATEPPPALAAPSSIPLGPAP